MFELGPTARVGFAALWLGGQVALVATAGSRSDASFGFRMFHESTTLTASLSRAVEAPSGHGTVVVPAAEGAWNARDPSGVLHRIRFRDRVHAPELSTFDTTMHASYGGAAQVARWQAALDDVAAHTPNDAETRQLFLDLTVRKNGHEPVTIHLASRPRG
jgi:hypothetical protein